MRRSLAVCSAAVLVVLAVGSQAAAQYEEEKPSKINVRLGIYRPSSSALRSGGSGWTMFGIDYTLALDGMSRPTRYISLERAAEDETGFKASIMPISYTWIWRGKEESLRTLYLGASAGLYFLSVSRQPWYPPPAGIDESGSKLGFAGIVGYEFNENYYVEFRYLKAGELAPAVDLSGFSLFVGVRNLF